MVVSAVNIHGDCRYIRIFHYISYTVSPLQDERQYYQMFSLSTHEYLMHTPPLID